LFRWSSELAENRKWRIGSEGEKAWRGKRRREQNGRWMGQIIEMLRGRRRGGGPVGGKDEARACPADGQRMVRRIGIKK
jgi:hypothetical protein